MNNIIAYIILLIQFNSTPPVVIRGHNYEGAIFPMEFEEVILGGTTNMRFTPTSNDVRLFEKIIRTQIKQINKNRIQQGKGYGPVIDRNMGKYIRQYIGYINKDGDRILHVSFLKKNSLIDKIRGYHDSTENWQSSWIEVLDGGSNFWRIDFNLNKEEFFNFDVNGIS